MGINMNDNYTGVIIKKLYKGKAEIRSYQLKTIKSHGRGIKFILNDEERYVPFEDLGKGKPGSYINARFPLPDGSRGYTLHSYVWDDLATSPPQKSQLDLDI